MAAGVGYCILDSFMVIAGLLLASLLTESRSASFVAAMVFKLKRHKKAELQRWLTIYQCHQCVIIYFLFYPLLRRVAIVLANNVAACSTSSSLDQRPSVK